MPTIRPVLYAIAAASLTLAAAAGASPRVTPAPMGFFGDSAAAQRSLERRFDAQLDASDLRAWLKQMSAAPTHVGAPHNKANAEFVQQQMRAWGWDAQIETFDVLYPTLQQHSLELLSPTPFKAKLKEPPVDGDATSSRTDALPPYHAYGADGDVTAELVYVNYGMPEDYEELARRNVDVKGKIVALGGHVQERGAVESAEPRRAPVV